MAQQMDDVIDRQPETNCDENRRAHSEEQLRRLRIASASIAASSSRGSTILGLVGFEGGIQEIAHGLSQLQIEKRSNDPLVGDKPTFGGKI